MTVATEDMREVQVRASAMAKKVGEARKELAMIKMARLRKREELFTVDREEHRLTAKLEVLMAEETSLEKTRTGKTAMVLDFIGRLSDNITGLGLFSAGDMKAGLEVRAEASLAMTLARESESLLVEEEDGLEESRRRLAEEAVRRKQAAKDQQAKEKKEKARLEAAQKEAPKKAEETRRVEAAKREAREKNIWSSPLSKAASRRDNKHLPRERPLQLGLKDTIPATKEDYKSGDFWSERSACASAYEVAIKLGVIFLSLSLSSSSCHLIKTP